MSSYPPRALFAAAVALWLAIGLPLRAAEPSASKVSTYAGAACAGRDSFFEDEVWSKVAAHSCLKCHKAGGDAEDSRLVLLDPARDASIGKSDSSQQNRQAFARMAARREGDRSRLLLKAVGELNHEGEKVLKPDSAEYRILAEFVRRITGQGGGGESGHTAAAPGNFYEGLAMLDPRRVWRRVTLSLAGRLPTAAEMATVQQRGVPAFAKLLDGVMKEDAFYDRLAEGFNDIFLTRGYDGLPERALSYEHFSETRGWTEKYDLSRIEDATARQRARYKLAEDYREAMLREPTELIKYIVRQERPFTEVVTADYIMESPYTARGYGNFDELQGQFRNVEDPFEYVPVKLASLRNRDGKNHQNTPTGFYPHAGILSTFQYLRRYPTTETNRNRLRARMYYQQFLGVDVLELAARVTDAAAVTAKFEVPTMQAAECVVCHKTIDPVAGLFQDFYNFEGVYGPRKDGWYKDMFGPGLEGEDMPPEEKWRALQWLGERTAKDPRFATNMVEHVFYLLTGRKTLLPPKALDDPEYDAKRRAYQAQRQQIETIATNFVKANFNLKQVFKDWIASDYYRVDGVTAARLTPARKAELADLGQAHMLAPEQLERKVAAIFGKPWGRLNDKQLAILYGGIDSKEVTERAADPSGAMGAIQRIMANDVACRHVAADFVRPAAERRLFPGIEPSVAPGESAEGDRQIREAIVHLHELILGRYDGADSPEVSRTFGLFAGILADAQSKKGVDPLENYSCRGDAAERVQDKSYTVRAWRGVVTYLLRQQDFLYE